MAETPSAPTLALPAADKKPLRVLSVEDSEFDARMMATVLRKYGYDVTLERVETAAGLRAALVGRRWDVILADYNLPEFSAPAALKILQESGIDMPFIVVSGGIGEDIAVAAMKAGAHDYLMKGNLSRLAPAVERELREAANRARQRAAELRYRLLWETCPDAVVLMDTESRIQFVNPAAQSTFGYAPEELVGQRLAHLQPAALVGPHRAGMARYLETGQKRLNWRATETVGRRKDGEEFPIEVSFSEMEMQGERLFVGFIRDITERKRAEAELRQNKEQLQVAREIQQHLFPKSSPDLPGFDVAGASYPADETGGDYFDYLPLLHGRLGVVIGDVAGHGIGPALLMAETRAYLRVLAGRREDVGEILTRTNGILAGDVGDERFVTLFLASLDPAARAFTYASAGHPAGYLLDASGEIRQRLPRTGPPLGIRADTPYAASTPMTLTSGDILVLLTDGIDEAMAEDNAFFGTERVLDVVRANRSRPAEAIVTALYEAVRHFSGKAGQMDDVTAIVVKVL